ncbi:MAG TPA: DUF1127 domain-containing protein [Kiloniellales bacterium]|nr:DUF1127 domain-containing protein [Kiloniellales bacterium]
MNSTPCTSQCADAAIEPRRSADILARLAALAAAVSRTLLDWQERASQRTQLASLDDHLLKDIGLSRADVERESALPFWRER